MLLLRTTVIVKEVVCWWCSIVDGPIWSLGSFDTISDEKTVGTTMRPGSGVMVAEEEEEEEEEVM